MGKAVKTATGSIGGLAGTASGLMAGGIPGAVLGGIAGKKLVDPITGALGLSLNGSEGPVAATQESAMQRLRNLSEGGLLGYAQDTFRAMPNQKDVFGEGGLQSRLSGEEQKLANQGFQLNTDDMTSYGQTAGDISRLFGQQEQAATQSLARRGLGSAASGAAGATFSGLAGNKNEMLAKAQTDIAQRRYQDTAKRLQQTRGMMADLSGQALSGIRGLASDRLGEMQVAAGSEKDINSERRQQLADQAAAHKPGLFETIGTGLQAGIGNLATAAPGMALGGLTGAPPAAGATGSGLKAPGTATAGRSYTNYGGYA